MSPKLLLGIGAIVFAVYGMTPVSAAEPMVLRRGNQAESETLDPSRATTAPENNIVGDMFLGLTTEDVESRVIPGAAESWTTSPDGLVWTFRLREGLKWSDGAPLKASDFVFGFRRLLDPQTAARYASTEYVIKNAEAVNTGKLPLDQVGVRAPNDRTVEITLEAPTPFLPGLMKHYTAYPIPEHVYKKYGEDWVHPGIMVSNGPYVLTEWSPHDHVKLIKNPHFYDAKNVRIDEVYFYPIEDENVALTRFRAGDIDANLGTRAVPIQQYPWIQENMPGQAHITPILANSYMALNLRRPPFNDRRVRRAVSLCIDREVIAKKVIRDQRVPAYAFVPPGISNYHNTARQVFATWPMDRRRAEAKRLLAEAGYGPDKPLTYEYLYNASIEQRRATVAEDAMLKECGVIVQPIVNELKVHYSRMQQADFTAGWGGWIGDYNDPQNFLFLLDSRSGVFNYGDYKNPEFDRLMDEAKVTLDLEARAALLARAEQIALDDDAVIPLDFSTAKELVSPAIKGFADNIEDIHRTRWMWLER
ncbi:MAG: peptide ABC transporter substrate-binding protein [Rhodospirillaceae bacterium]